MSIAYTPARLSGVAVIRLENSRMVGSSEAAQRSRASSSSVLMRLLGGGHLAATWSVEVVTELVAQGHEVGQRADLLGVQVILMIVEED